MSRKPPKPQQPERRFILPPELDCDDDEETPTSGPIPDDDGWIRLNRQKLAVRRQSAKKANSKKRPR